MKPINAGVLRTRVRMHLALKNQRHELERMVAERTAQLEHTRVELIKRLSRAMEFHESAAVGNRVMRLGHYAKLLAQAAGVKPEIAEVMLKAAPLHDIGKLGVPAEILRKTEQLSVPDWERVKRNPHALADRLNMDFAPEPRSGTLAAADPATAAPAPQPAKAAAAKPAPPRKPAVNVAALARGAAAKAKK